MDALGGNGGADYTDRDRLPSRMMPGRGLESQERRTGTFIIAVRPWMCILPSRIQMAADIHSTLPIGEHRLMSRIGVGAYGEVWLVESVVGTRRAAKILSRSHFEHERPYEREFEGLQRYEPVSRSHEGLVDILQIGRDDAAGCFYYVMELADPADGPGAEYVPLTLKEYAARRGGRLGVREAADLGARLAAALAHLHQAGLVHRDIKPSNIIFVGGLPKLADVGLVTGRGGDSSYVGTEGYVPREGPGTPAADTYALGLMLYELCSGRHRLDFPDVPRDFPDEQEASAWRSLNPVLLRCCEARAARRFTDAGDLRTELVLVHAGENVLRLRRAERRLRWMKRASLALVAAGVLATAALAWQAGETRRAEHMATLEHAAADKARQSAHTLRLNLYAADMASAQRAMDHANADHARELLAAYLPAAGAPDLRGFAWHWLMAELKPDPHRRLAGHTGQVRWTGFGPDGALLSAGLDGTVRRWEAEQSTILTRVPEAASLNAVLPLADGSMILGGKFSAWRWQRGSDAPPELVVERTTPWWAVSPDEKWLAGSATWSLSAAAPVNAVLRSLTDGAEREIPGSGNWGVFAPDSATFISGVRDGHFRRWSGAGFSVAGEVLDGAPEQASVCLGLTFSPDGTRLAAGLSSGALLLWEWPSGKRLHRVELHAGKGVWRPAFSADGTLVATAGSDRTACITDVASGRVLRQVRGHEGEVHCAAFSPDGKSLATGSKEPEVRRWPLDLPEARRAAAPKTKAPPVFDATGALAVMADGVHPLSVRRTADWSEAATFGQAEEWPLAFVEDGRVFLTTMRFWEVTRWDWKSGTALSVVRLEKPPEGSGPAVALSPDARWLAGGTGPGLVVIWDVLTGKIAARLAGHRGEMMGLVFSPDGNWLATGGADRQPRVWNTADWTCRHVLPVHGHVARYFAFAPNGREFLTTAYDGRCRMFDLATGALLRTLLADTNSVDDARFLRDGHSLAVMQNDDSVLLIDTRTWRETVRLPPRATGPGHLQQLALSPDGALLFAFTSTATTSAEWRTVPAPPPPLNSSAPP